MSPAHSNVMEKHFRSIRPLIFVMALYGIVPISFKPPGVSYHPFRSTILWVVVLNLLVGSSVFEVLRTHWPLQFGYWTSSASDGHREHIEADVDLQLLALQGMVHVSSHVMLFIIWLELPNLRSHLQHWKQFLSHHGNLISGLKVSRCLPVTAWFVVLCVLVIFPTLTLWYFMKTEFYSGGTGSRMRHVPAHLFQTAFFTLVVALFAVFCHTVRDMAASLREKLERELAAGNLTPGRLRAFRMAWLSLRELLRLAGALPVSGIFLFGYLLLMITFSVYHSLASLYKGALMFALSSFFILSHSVALLLWCCDSAHQATDTINSFGEPLRKIDWMNLSKALRFEFQQLEHVIEVLPAEVSFAGFFSIHRSSFLTMGASVVTYVIVIIQFRKDDASTTPNLLNATLPVGGYFAD